MLLQFNWTIVLSSLSQCLINGFLTEFTLQGLISFYAEGVLFKNRATGYCHNNCATIIPIGTTYLEYWYYSLSGSYLGKLTDDFSLPEVCMAHF